MNKMYVYIYIYFFCLFSIAKSRLASGLRILYLDKTGRIKGRNKRIGQAISQLDWHRQRRTEIQSRKSFQVNVAICIK